MAARLGACLQLPRTIMEGDLKVYSCTVVFSPFLLLLRSTKNLNNRELFIFLFYYRSAHNSLPMRARYLSI